MKFFKKRTKNTEKKGFGEESSNRGYFLVINGENVDYSTSQFIRSYVDACPVFTATKKITSAAASIEIVLRNKKDGSFKYDHDILKLLQNPDPFTDRNLFIESCLSNYILTGNCYINVIGEKTPIELNVLRPQNISIIAHNDGYAGNYDYSSSNGLSRSYLRNSGKKFFDSRQNEIIHLKNYNPRNYLYGASSFLGCQLEIAQYIEASIHNYSLLKNGARPSGILTYKGSDTLQSDQIEKVRNAIKMKLSGSSNAGEPAFLGGDFAWQAVSESVKDMDFKTLKESVANATYTAVNIPLPMINSDSMTFSNMDAAKYAFYDNSVLPTFKRFLEFLTAKLLTRYKDAANYELYFDESAIEALQGRKFENAKLLSQIGTFSDNEIRAVVGYESIAGGDAIYRPMNLLPTGQDILTTDNRVKPVGKSEFIRIMKDQQKLDGSKMYNDDYIALKAKEYYGD